VGGADGGTKLNDVIRHQPDGGEVGCASEGLEYVVAQYHDLQMKRFKEDQVGTDPDRAEYLPGSAFSSGVRIPTNFLSSSCRRLKSFHRLDVGVLIENQSLFSPSWSSSISKKKYKKRRGGRGRERGWYTGIQIFRPLP